MLPTQDQVGKAGYAQVPMPYSKPLNQLGPNDLGGFELHPAPSLPANDLETKPQPRATWSHQLWMRHESFKRVTNSTLLTLTLTQPKS